MIGKIEVPRGMTETGEILQTRDIGKGPTVEMVEKATLEIEKVQELQDLQEALEDQEAPALPEDQVKDQNQEEEISIIVIGPVGAERIGLEEAQKDLIEETDEEILIRVEEVQLLEEDFLLKSNVSDAVQITTKLPTAPAIRPSAEIAVKIVLYTILLPNVTREEEKITEVLLLETRTIETQIQ